MNWLPTFLAALLTGVLGLFVAGCVASACVRWYRISSFEGGSGYFVVFTAMCGGIVSFISAIIVCRQFGTGFLHGTGLSCALVALTGGIAAMFCYRLADIPPQIDGRTLNLEIELRLPAGERTAPANVTGESSLTLGSVVNHVQRNSRPGELRLGAARFEDNRWIIPGSVFLFTQRGLRCIDIELGGRSVGGFIVPLPARPGAKFEEWSDWGPRGRSIAEPWPDTRSSYRFRIRRDQPSPNPAAEVSEVPNVRECES